ncbi:CheY-like chemotaxis protein [Salegentibacter sp. 24]|nr:CheY-like chemotaxis protein [Salegentibacter sp. 24]
MINIPLRILLVEDEKTDVVLIKRNIYQVVEKPVIEVVNDFPDFESVFKNFLPDLVISDFSLPSGTGLDVLELIKSIDESIPLIFITGALDDDELAAETIVSGASGFILKKHMSYLDQKLEPLLKQVVYNMIQHDELRERIRKNKIAIHQIYGYLESMKADDKEQRDNIKKIKNNLNKFNIENAE